ncbi:hypothetical protein OF83DRAFT_1080638 [Amylostereum chailletii]|nr:hypothetical protein OF83DRAFT_1080638 [Amylostereum chailletii]
MSTFVPPPFPPLTPLPEYLIRVAQAYPDREVVLFLQDNISEDEAKLVSVSWRQFLADVWSRADYLVETTGIASRAPEEEPLTVGLLAENNYLFLVTLTAMFMLRWTALLISVRNSPDAIRHLMRTTGSDVVLVDKALSHLHSDLLVHDPNSGFTPLVITREPMSSDSTRDGLERATEFLQESEASYSREDLRNEAQGPCIYLHTSGSTGHPKAIAWSHEFLLAISASSGRDRALCKDDILYTCFPLFHAGGICTSFPFFLGSGASFVCLDSWRSVSSDTILRHLRILKHRKVDASLPPSMLEDIADSADPHSLATLRAQNTVFWGGAPLRHTAGDFLVKHGVRLVAWGGMTEAGPLARSSLEPNADLSDWAWMRLVDCYQFNFIPMKGDARQSRPPPVVNSVEPLGFATVDAWTRHPDPNKPHLWKPAGRLDDVTVLSNGEKTDNKQLESLLCASPLIHHAIIFGTGRFVNGAIISPSSAIKADTEEAKQKYLDAILPHVDGYVNRIVPQHSRLLPGMILVANRDRPFLLSDKGTVKTKASLALYADDINSAYEALESGMGSSGQLAFPADSPDEGSILQFVKTLVANAIGRDLQPGDDFFRNGMDSLLATKVRTSTGAALRRAGFSFTLPRNVVYAHPTCISLARYLHIFVLANPDHTSAAAPLAISNSQIEKTIARFTSAFPRHTGTRPLPEDGDVYAVTGTTGSLGATYVAYLLEQPTTKRLFLLNRGHPKDSMAKRHQTSFKEKGLNFGLLEEAVVTGRAVYVEIDVGRKRLGLSDDLYAKLASQLTHIVHNAWLLNFNLFLPSFEPHVAGTRSIIDLALSSTYASPPHLSFISSIGVAGQWPFADRLVPEAPLDSAEFCLPQGYAHAKYVAEQIMQSAVEQRPELRATVIRSGQLSGTTTTGSWAKTEYIPRMMKGASKMGIIPTGLRPVRWLPVDVAAKILFREVEHGAASPASGQLSFYNLENAKATPWSRVVDAVIRYSDRPMRTVSMDAWLDRLRKDPENPAFAVADYLEELLSVRPVPALETVEARRAAGDLVDCEVDFDIVGRYVRFACSSA